MAKVRFKYKKDAFTKLRTSPEALALVERLGRQVESAAGPGHRLEVGVTVGRAPRARAAVITDTFEARKASATSNTLVRALGAARG